MAIGGVGFISWISLFRISHVIFPEIQKRLPQLYGEILPDSGSAWLERGWYSPLDAGVQVRLYAAIYHGKANKVLSLSSWRIFVWAIRIFIFTSIVFVILSITSRNPLKHLFKVTDAFGTSSGRGGGDIKWN